MGNLQASSRRPAVLFDTRHASSERRPGRPIDDRETIRGRRLKRWPSEKSYPRTGECLGGATSLSLITLQVGGLLRVGHLCIRGGDNPFAEPVGVYLGELCTV